VLSVVRAGQIQPARLAAWPSPFGRNDVELAAYAPGVPEQGPRRMEAASTLQLVEVPKPPDMAKRPGGPGPVTLHLDDVDVRKVLEMLSRDGRENILISPGVRGRVTADLQEMGFEEAFQSILKVCNLVAYREGGIVFVHTAEERANSQRTLRVFVLDHVAPADVEQAVKGLLSPSGKSYTNRSRPGEQ